MVKATGVVVTISLTLAVLIYIDVTDIDSEARNARIKETLKAGAR